MIPKIPSAVKAFLQQPYLLTAAQIDFYHTHRYIKLKHVLDEPCLQYFAAIIRQLIQKLNTDQQPLGERSTYGKAFLQLFNMWRMDENIRELVFSKRIARLAADLMQVDGVRLYHDQALCKEAGGGITPWHADQYYWPLQTDKTITAWIPLQATPLAMGPIEFSAGSHKIMEGRDLEISDDSEEKCSNGYVCLNFHTSSNLLMQVRSVSIRDGYFIAPA